MCDLNEARKKKIVELSRRVAELEQQLAPPLPPVIRAEITIAELTAYLAERFPGVPLYLSDNVKKLCDIEDIEAFLEQDQSNRTIYVAEKYDCDDFAYRLMGQFSIPDWAEVVKGLVWTDQHALVCCIDANRDFWWLEPQTDGIQSSLEPWQGAAVRFIMM